MPSAGYFFSDNWLISANLLGGLHGGTGIRKRAGAESGEALTATGEIRRLRMFAEGSAAYTRSQSKLNWSAPLRETFNSESGDGRARPV